jgi:hypothetical protein
MIPTGKGYFIWIITRCGSPTDIALLAKASGISHVFIKIADGIADFGIVSGHDLAKELADALKVQGIEPWGWQYVYLANPKMEADKAIERIHETGVVGFAIDAEAQAKGKPAEARVYCDALRLGMPDLTIGLSSYRFPSLHPELPWVEFRRICQFDMPQVYWCKAHNPGYQLRKSVNEFAGFTKKLPYVGTGAAYREWGWQPTLSEINEFMATATELNIPFNFWEWYDARFVLPREIWDAIAAWNYEPTPPPPPPPLPDKVRVTAVSLNVRAKPMGLILGQVKKGWLLGVDGEQMYNGVRWYRIGTGYVSSEWVEAIE